MSEAYTKEDYLETDKPFAELFAVKNMFEQKRQLEKMAIAAKAVGVANFKSLYAAYCDSMRTAFVPEENVTTAQGQPQELNCGDWTVDEYGVRRGVGSCEVIACQFPAALKILIPEPKK